MSYSSKNQSSRRDYAEINGSGYGTHDNYPNRYRPWPPRARHVDESFHTHAPHDSHREYHRHATPRARHVNDSFHTHALHDSHREYHRHASYDNCGPRNYVTSHNGEFITSRHQSTTSYGESTTSYHQSTTTYYTTYHGPRGGMAHESHRSSSHAPALDDEDERYFSDTGKHCNSRSNDRWEEDAEGKRNDHHYQDRRHRQEGPQPREPKPKHTDGYASIPKNHNNHRYTANNSPGQGKPDKGSSQRQKKPHSSRSDPFHKDRGKNPPQDTLQSRAKEELPDHYATLRVEPLATEEEIKSAAKRRRVEVHPDKLKKPGMSASELAKIDDAAAKVGLAADCKALLWLFPFLLPFTPFYSPNIVHYSKICSKNCPC